MGDIEGWKWAVGTVVTLIGTYFLWKGVRYTADRARSGVDRTAEVDEQQSALDAWKELVTPYREEVVALRAELTNERAERLAKERMDRVDREAAAERIQTQMAALTERIDLLTLQLNEWKRLAKTIARWATRLRDEVLRLGGEVPATPDELLTLRAIEEAEEDRAAQQQPPPPGP